MRVHLLRSLKSVLTGLVVLVHATSYVQVLPVPRAPTGSRLVVPFAVLDGHLEIGTPASRNGLRATEQLWLVRNHSRFVITSLNDLRGRVRIKSPEQALAYVRLLTSIATYRTIPRRKEVLEIEVVRREDLSAGMFYGDLGLLSFAKSATDGTMLPPGVPPQVEEGFWGIVSSRAAQTIGIPPTSCEVHSGTYDINRTLLVEGRDRQNTRSRLTVEHVVESVSSDGDFRELERKVIAMPSKAEVYWWMPMGPM